MAQVTEQSILSQLKRRVGASPGRVLLVCFCAAMAFACICVGVTSVQSNSFAIEREGAVEHAGSSAVVDGGAGAEQPDVALVVVDVSGAVVASGVYELEEGSRVQDAIQAAGGLQAEADISGINRASKLVDGQKLYIPLVGETVAVETVVTGSDSASGSYESTGNALVNINTAGLEELQTLSGVGPSTAQAIIDDRTQNGAFASIEDIMRVSGIGEKKFAKIQGSICV